MCFATLAVLFLFRTVWTLYFAGCLVVFLRELVACVAVTQDVWSRVALFHGRDAAYRQWRG